MEVTKLVVPKVEAQRLHGEYKGVIGFAVPDESRHMSYEA